MLSVSFFRTEKRDKGAIALSSLLLSENLRRMGRRFFLHEDMLGYLFIVIALLAGATKGYCGKKTSGYVLETKDALLFNSVRMMLCILVGFFLILAQGNIAGLAMRKDLTAVTAFSGAANAFFVVSWMLAVRKNTYMMVDVALMIGCIIPAIGCAVFFDEPISGTKMIGFALLLAAVVLMAGYNNRLKGKMSPLGVILLVITGFSEGMLSFTQQIYKFRVQDETATPAVYNFYMYLFSALLLLLFFFLFVLYDRKRPAKKSGDSKEENKAGNKEGKGGLLHVIPYIIVMAVCLFANSYFQTLATTVGTVPSQVLYPVMKGGSLILSTAMSAAFFGERVTKWSILGTVTAFAGLICINLL